jgi:hypothetical protein
MARAGEILPEMAAQRSQSTAYNTCLQIMAAILNQFRPRFVTPFPLHQRRVHFALSDFYFHHGTGPVSAQRVT